MKKERNEKYLLRASGTGRGDPRWAAMQPSGALPIFQSVKVFSNVGCEKMMREVTGSEK
jgi:hypothetical protein